MTRVSLGARIRGIFTRPLRKYGGHRDLPSVVGTLETLLRLRGDVNDSAVRVSDITEVLEETLSYHLDTTPHGGTGGGGTVAWVDVTGKPSTYPPSAHTHPWGQITGTPATYPPSTHTHTWGQIVDPPATYPPSAHTHPYAPQNETELLNTWKYAYNTGYKEYTYSGGTLTGVGIWATAAKLVKLFTCSYSYSGGQLTSMTIVDELSAKQLTRAFSYTGTQLSTVTESIV